MWSARSFRMEVRSTGRRRSTSVQERYCEVWRWRRRTTAPLRISGVWGSEVGERGVAEEREGTAGVAVVAE
jgi:hypothetical protein